MEKKYWSRKEVALFLSLSIKTVDRMVTNDELPFYRLRPGVKGSRVLFPIDEVKNWYETRRNAKPSDGAANS